MGVSDARRGALTLLAQGESGTGWEAEAQVWALIHIGDAIDRLADALKPPDELAERRQRREIDLDSAPPPELSA